MKRSIDQEFRRWKTDPNRKTLLVRRVRQVGKTYSVREIAKGCDHFLEVKSGTQGKMQSLRLFLREKKINHGIRISMENFDQYENIRVFPLYAVQNILNPK